jgi:hypothetical protein
MKRFFIGIDNGLTGACAVLMFDGKVHDFLPAPIIGGKRKQLDEVAMAQFLRPYAGRLTVTGEIAEESVAFVEAWQVGRPSTKSGRPGVVSMASFGFGCGLWRGMLVMAKIPYEIVTAATWRRYMLIGAVAGKQKQASVAAAKRLWPDVNLKRSANCTKDSDGISDALLIAEYGRRVFAGRGRK